MEKAGQVVMPGEVIGTIDPTKTTKIGIGIIQNQENLIATKCGILRSKGNHIWVDNRQKRYVPVIEDMVIGVVLERHVENAKVDVGGAVPATLPMLAFEGASRKNRPNLHVGTIVYARVVVANKDMEPELVCTAANGKAEGFGILTGGYMFKISLSLARQLLSPDCVVLQEVGKTIPFEIAVGQNGRVWIHSNSNTQTMIISNAILNSEFLSPAQTRDMVQQLLKRAALTKQ